MTGNGCEVSGLPAPVPCASPRSIVVVGGGVTGVLSAWELARSGHRVVLVEARHIGSGASSRSAACIRAQFETPSTVRGLLYAVSFFERWTGLIPASQPVLKANGYLFLKGYSDDLDAVRGLVSMQREAGLKEVEFLDVDALNGRFPYIDSIGLTGATWCPRDGFLYPGIIYQDGAEAARSLGVEIVQNDPVVAVRSPGSHPEAAILGSGKAIEADLFVNATNVWAPAVSAIFGGVNLAIRAERRYLYLLAGLKASSDWGLDLEDFPALPMTVTPSGAYFRPENQQLMIGWLQHARPVTPTLDNQDEVEPGFGLGASDYGAAVRKEITQFLPAAQDMGRLVAVTAGFYDTTPDHNPMIGFDPKVENLVHAAGFSGHGLMHAPFSARIVAELAAAGRDLEDIGLPWALGRVDLKPYGLCRDFSRGEGLVL